jgi:hypothetical protein
LLVRPENCLEEVEMMDLVACLATDNILRLGFGLL